MSAEEFYSSNKDSNAGIIIEKIYNELNSKTQEFVDKTVMDNLDKIAQNSFSQKGVYTVLLTLMLYKFLHPNQDIRYHQKKMKGGFSGRTFDTKYVTPTLKKLGLPAMAESGWLTRSLEQPRPYTLDYNGEIQAVKKEFLDCVDYVQRHPDKTYTMMHILIKKVADVAKDQQVEITPLENPENLTIESIIMALDEHFNAKYGTHNGAKLPVLAFHSIYRSLIKEMERYHGCRLAELSSLNACDSTNKASGDIEIFKEDKVFESIEIKLDKKINAQILRVAKSKIYIYNPCRYYILSVYGIEESDREEINNIVDDVLNNHGCQIIINGLIPTIKYYLRLITNLKDFISYYSEAVQNDTELQKVHKEKWEELLEKYAL